MDPEDSLIENPPDASQSSGQQPEQPERRKKPRYPIDEDATLVIIQHNATHPCKVLDLSQGGCRIRLNEPFSMGLSLRVEVVFKVLGVPFRLPGVTQWVDRRRGAGIRFLEMPQRRVDALVELVEEVKADLEARAAKEAAKAAAEASAEATPATAIKPAPPVAKSSGMPPPIPWPSPSRPAEASPADSRTRTFASESENGSIKRVEPIRPAPTKDQQGRRAAPRHPVDTNAEIYLIDIAAHVHGRILDLSLGGCHIRSDDRFPVGIFRRVETEFMLEGLPFRLAGVTQAIYDRRNVGIRFLDMSERKREQLTQLIAELEATLAQENGEGAQNAPFLPEGPGGEGKT